MGHFDIKKFLTENKLTTNSRLDELAMERSNIAKVLRDFLDRFEKKESYDPRIHAEMADELALQLQPIFNEYTTVYTPSGISTIARNMAEEFDKVFDVLSDGFEFNGRSAQEITDEFIKYLDSRDYSDVTTGKEHNLKHIKI